MHRFEYAVFWTDHRGPVWVRLRNRRRALTLARHAGATVHRMPIVTARGPWDAPTYRALSDRIADYTPKELRS